MPAVCESAKRLARRGVGPLSERAGCSCACCAPPVSLLSGSLVKPAFPPSPRSPRRQFAASKALPGGPEGVAVLSAAVPLGRTLVLAHVDLESLENPELLPVSSEVLAARNAQSVASLSRASSPSAGGWCGWGGTRGGEGGGGGGSAPCEGVAQQPAAAVPPPGSSASVGKRREHRLQWQQQQVLHLGPPSPERGASAAAAAEGGAACTLPSPSGLHEDVHLTHYPTMLLGLNSSGSVDAGDRAAGSGATDGEPGPCMPRPA